MLDLKEFEGLNGLDRKRLIQERYPHQFQEVLALSRSEHCRTFAEALYLYTRKPEEGDVGRCAGCERRAVFASLHKGYKKFCSKICSNKTNKNQRLRTMEERYGVQYTMQSKTLKEKLQKTCLEKYGDEVFARTTEFKTVIKKSAQKKYGKDHHNQDEGNKKKIEQTYIKNWGKKNVIHHPLIKERIRKTMLERYGVENPAYIHIGEELREYIHLESWWRGLYTEDGMTIKEIVQETGLSESFVYKKLAQFKLLNREDEIISKSRDYKDLFRPIF